MDVESIGVLGKGCLHSKLVSSCTASAHAEEEALPAA